VLSTTTDTAPADFRSLYQEMWADVEPESSRRLLIAALEAFATTGFAGSTTRQIAERAEMSPAGLYVNYKSKGDLLFAIVLTEHNVVMAEVAEVVERSIPAPEKLRAFVETFVIFHARYHLLAFVGEYELRSLEPDQLAPISRLRHRYRHLVEGVLLQGIATGDFEVADLSGTARTILSLGTDVARWFRSEGPLTPQDVAALQSDLVLRMVRRVPAV
jgi:AcrR family transcriptional regulator